MLSRPLGTRRWRALLAVAFGGLAAPLAADQFLRPAAGEKLEAGETALVSWRMDAACLRNVDEMELLLSLDGGKRFLLRVTARIDPRTPAWAWRVPALPSAHARLAVRGGRGEKASAEDVILLGPEFSIVESGRLPAEELSAEAGELRTREAASSPAVPLSPADCASPPRIGPLAVLDVAVVKSGTPALPPPASFDEAPAAPRVPTDRPRGAGLARLPVTVPR